MSFGGTNVPTMVKTAGVSIFKGSEGGNPRVHLPTENPKYPETKHTIK